MRITVHTHDICNVLAVATCGRNQRRTRSIHQAADPKESAQVAEEQPASIHMITVDPTDDLGSAGGGSYSCIETQMGNGASQEHAKIAPTSLGARLRVAAGARSDAGTELRTCGAEEMMRETAGGSRTKRLGRG
ncbi:hypothetical protein MN608_05777 [Microdochium nivale]|nr:hypothetical protein MN608_05777 [Microdochium nivale]